MQEIQEPNVLLSTVTHALIESINEQMRNLIEKLPSMLDPDRKYALVKFFRKTRVQLVRLLILVKWAKDNSVVDRIREMMDFITEQDYSFLTTADKLYELRAMKLRNAVAPPYDVITAVDVLGSGTFPRLPSFIKNSYLNVDFNNIPKDLRLNEDNVDSVVERLNLVIATRLLSTTIPTQFQNNYIYNGKLHCTVPNMFEVTFTSLNGINPWTLGDGLKILITPDNFGGKLYYGVQETAALTSFVQQHMESSETPLITAYEILNEICSTMVLDILYKQLNNMKNSIIRIQDIKYQDENDLTIYYWKYSKNDLENSYYVNVSFRNKALIVDYHPEISKDTAPFEINPTKVSCMKLLRHSAKLHIYKYLQNIMEVVLDSNPFSECSFSEDGKYLEVPLFHNYKLLIMGNISDGSAIVNVLPKIPNCDITKYTTLLNKNIKTIDIIIDELFKSSKLAVMKNICNRLKLKAYSHFPMSHGIDEQVNLSEHRLFLFVPNITDYSISVDLKTRDELDVALISTKKIPDSDKPNHLHLRKIYPIRVWKDELGKLNVEFGEEDSVNEPPAKKMRYEDDAYVPQDQFLVLNTLISKLHDLVIEKVNILLIIDGCDDNEIRHDKIDNDGDDVLSTYLLHLISHPLSIDYTKLIIKKDFKWKIIIKEGRESLLNIKKTGITLTNRKLAVSKTPEIYRSVKYENRSWVFEYSSIHKSVVGIFKQDLKNLCKGITVSRTLEKHIKKGLPDGLEIRTVGYSSTMIFLKYGWNNECTKSLSIKIDSEKPYQIKFYRGVDNAQPEFETMSDFVEAKLQETDDIGYLIKFMQNSLSKLIIVENFLRECSTNWFYLSKSEYQIVLLYKSQEDFRGASIYFLGEGFVYLEDLRYFNELQSREIKPFEQNLNIKIKAEELYPVLEKWRATYDQ
eukprot:TRINITY_DN670_c0_g1_i1.p1 TRINITY_DN670_c0_g1~~TRINITY_DN670_c0_g1_i1.p1  ORF type:complete len:913 (-),score=182.12 TRINITY_DN670_c0_g1_i1:2454-5192(-)